MEDSAKRRDDILRKVGALLAKAESTEFSEERDAFIAKADAMMNIYAIEAFELEMAKDRSSRRKPILAEIEYGRVGHSIADEEMPYIFEALAKLVRCKIGWFGWYKSKVVGYPEDIEFLKMLFVNIRLHLAMQLEPKPDPKLSFEENLAMLKEAGLKWERIYHLLHQAGMISDPWERKVGVRFTGIYTRYCKDNNRPRMYSNPEVWRRNFIQGYAREVRDRINKMRGDRESAGSGKELVLQSMADELLEALYTFFPEQRPHPPECDCDSCHAAKCFDRNCSRPVCVARRAPVKYSRSAYRTVKEKKFDASAYHAGRRSGQEADLGSNRGAPSGARKEIN